MDKEHIYDLLLRSYDQELDQEEQMQLEEAFSKYPEIALEKNNIDEMRAMFAGYNFSFSEGFSEKILTKVENLKHNLIEHDFTTYLVRNFRKVAVFGAAAILVILGSIYFTSGSLNVDTITGINQLNSENISSLILFEY